MPRIQKSGTSYNRIIASAVLGTLAFSLAFGFSKTTKAYDMEDYVNAKIKEEFIKVEGEDLHATVEFSAPEKNLHQVSERPRPMEQTDPTLQNVDPTTLGEQAGVREMPRPGVNVIDPTDPVEQRVAAKQAYEMYRENYRRKVQAEFVERARKAGWIINRNIAAEIKAREDLLPTQY